MKIFVFYFYFTLVVLHGVGAMDSPPATVSTDFSKKLDEFREFRDFFDLLKESFLVLNVSEFLKFFHSDSAAIIQKALEAKDLNQFYEENKLKEVSVAITNFLQSFENRSFLHFFGFFKFLKKRNPIPLNDDLDYSTTDINYFAAIFIEFYSRDTNQNNFKDVTDFVKFFSFISQPGFHIGTARIYKEALEASDPAEYFKNNNHAPAVITEFAKCQYSNDFANIFRSVKNILVTKFDKIFGNSFKEIYENPANANDFVKIFGVARKFLDFLDISDYVDPDLDNNYVDFDSYIVAQNVLSFVDPHRTNNYAVARKVLNFVVARKVLSLDNPDLILKILNFLELDDLNDYVVAQKTLNPDLARKFVDFFNPDQNNNNLDLAQKSSINTLYKDFFGVSQNTENNDTELDSRDSLLIQKKLN